MATVNQINIVNLVDSLKPVNMGIWDAALKTSHALEENHNIKSFLVAPDSEWNQANDYSVVDVCKIRKRTPGELTGFVKQHGLSPGNTVFCAHGCWNFPNRFLHHFSSLGFQTVSCPQGMLEPWSMQQKSIRKRIFFRLFEQSRISSANVIRAVSTPEKKNLRDLFPNSQVCLIPNSTADVGGNPERESSGPIRFVFLGRLHPKKCPMQLAEAFIRSSLKNDAKFELVIAGPDQGLRSKINDLIESHGCQNVVCRDGVFGSQKAQMLMETEFFVLPSHSEGFPTAVIEAMSLGCIPIISLGCNFPEANSNNLGFEVGTDIPSIKTALESAAKMTVQQRRQASDAAVRFIVDHYSTDIVASQQCEMFSKLLSGKSESSLGSGEK
jgi:glycosyltransferase involved in cell wall biosynthesis